MSWEQVFLPEAVEDLKKLDGSIRNQVIKGIDKVSTNPLPVSEGGYGKPLGNKRGIDLTGFLKIKFLNIGIRVVYTLIREKGIMKIVIVSVRSDEQVYKEALVRKQKHVM